MASETMQVEAKGGKLEASGKLFFSYQH